jgi:hypothetical protein
MRRLLQLSAFSLSAFLMCCTIVPKPAPPPPIPKKWLTSLDAQGNGRLSGEGHEVYNELIQSYGPKFLPHLVPNAGVSAIDPATGACTLDFDHCGDFGMMLFWRDNPQQLPP